LIDRSIDQFMNTAGTTAEGCSIAGHGAGVMGIE